MGKRKTSSIVWKINAYIQNGRFWEFLCCDIALLIAGTVCWCIASECQYGQFVLERTRTLFYAPDANWWERAVSVGYTFVPVGELIYKGEYITDHQGMQKMKE